MTELQYFRNNFNVKKKKILSVLKKGVLLHSQKRKKQFFLSTVW